MAVKMTVKKKECTGYNKEVYRHLKHPLTVYHVTTNFPKVCYEGLKPIDELRTYRSGVGGGHSGVISFTYDPNLAIDYKKDIQTVVRISNGTVTPKNICKYLDKHDASKKLTKSPCGIWNKVENNDGMISGLIDHPYPSEFHFLRKGLIWDKTKCYDMSDEKCYRKGSKDDIQERLLHVFRYDYLTNRSRYGGRQNPVFYNTSVKDNKFTKVEDIQIIKAMAMLPFSFKEPNDDYVEIEDPITHAKITILSAEKEIRIPKEYYTRLELWNPSELKSEYMPKKKETEICSKKQMGFLTDAIKKGLLFTDIKNLEHDRWMDVNREIHIVTKYKGLGGLSCIVDNPNSLEQEIELNNEIIKDDPQWSLHEFPHTYKYESKVSFNNNVTEGFRKMIQQYLMSKAKMYRQKLELSDEMRISMTQNKSKNETFLWVGIKY